ncbi:MAG: hypothetical protein HUJ94_09060 [Bacteroidales bacterium]|nr:hypothetical protein [Bacteroidales bacterium]
MRKYKVGNERFVEVEDLSFLRDREKFNWLSRHWFSFRHRKALRKADHVIAMSEDVAHDVVRYYFIPKYKVTTGDSGRNE